MATVINVPRDTRFGELGLGLAQGASDLAKRRKSAAFQRALEEMPDNASDVDLARTFAPFIEDEGDLAKMVFLARQQARAAKPRTITVHKPTGESRTLEVPSGAPAFQDVRQIDTQLGTSLESEGFTLTKPVEETDASVRSQRIQDLVIQGVPRERAVRLVDKHQRIEVVEELGVVRLVDAIDGTAYEVPLSSIADGELDLNTTLAGSKLLSREPTEPASDISELLPEGAGEGEAVEGPATLFEFAKVGTGPWSALRAGFTRALGFVGDPEFLKPLKAVKTIDARQAMRILTNEFARSLVINQRFPVAEVERIIEEGSIQPEFIDSETAMHARQVSLDRQLRRRMQDAEADSEDLSLPLDVREAQRANARAIRNFLPVLGVPESFRRKEGGQAVPSEERFGRFGGMPSKDLKEFVKNPANYEKLSDEELVQLRDALRAVTGAK